MALPGDITTIQVTGTFTSGAGTGENGSVTFTPNSMLTDPGGLVIIPAVPAVKPPPGTSWASYI